MYKDIDVVIIGAGAAGMMAAATASQRGRGVVLIDHAENLAEKIRISGGGRCNFTNIYTNPECYLSANPHFCKSALAQYTATDFIDLVNKYHISWHEKKLGQLFCDHSAQHIIDMLIAECNLGKTEWRTNTQIINIEKSSSGFTVHTSYEHWRCQTLIIATGGLSIPAIGATGFGYDLAKKFNLSLIPATPGLVPLTFEPRDLYTELAGISLDCYARTHSSPAFRENILFTHKGVSGPVVLQISSYWKPGETIVLDLLPDQDADMIFKETQSSHTLLPNVLAEYLPKRFAQIFCASLTDIRPMNQYSSAELATIANQLHHWSVIPSGTQGYKKAEVTCGGINTTALSSKSMQAKQIPGLFFIGEVVDVTGWLGGYNFQWAWSSGWVAGQYA